MSTANEQGGNGVASTPVPIIPTDMSAPPPNYASLDRYGHPRTDLTEQVAPQQQRQQQRQEVQGLQEYRDDADAASIASDDSDESATLLLGDALPDRDVDVDLDLDQGSG